MELKIGKETDFIKKMVVEMATLTEESVRDAIDAFLNCSSEKAKLVIERDAEINSMEIAIDKEIFECLALKAPVAGDLRLLFSMQKINKDLERIGDHAVNIAQAASNCQGFGKSLTGPDIKIMANATSKMLSDAITCFIDNDTQLALSILEHDDQVDELNRTMSREVINLVKKDVTTVESALELLRVSKNLERIADLTTNIAEDVIFHAKATDVKHKHLSSDKKINKDRTT